MLKRITKDQTAMIVAVAAIILIIVMGFSSRQRENITVLEQWVGNIVTPFQKIVSRTTHTIGEGLSSIINFSRIKKENEQLKKQVESLQKEVIELKLNRDELNELNELKLALNYIRDNEEFEPVTANITGKNPGNWFNMFTIDVGKNQGISIDNVVVASNGLVGRVYEVGGNWAKVISIIDNNSSISFQILRDGSTQGILTGSITNELSGYLFDPLAEVVVGDKLITSDLGIFPKGILIGEVVEVTKSSNQLLKTICVEPAVNFKKISKVLVMKPKNI